jgi:hypothetical protein
VSIAAPAPPARARAGALIALGGLGLVVTAGFGTALVSVAVTPAPARSDCSPSSAGPAAVSILVGGPGGGALVGATEYGGPGDPSSGTVGASGANLLQHPDTYAELGGYTFGTATALGGLPYGTPLRITWHGRSAVAYKRDFGFGGGPIDGLPRVIDLWWQFASALRIPYDDGLWSGPVRISRPPAAGAGGVLGQSYASVAPVSGGAIGSGAGTSGAGTSDAGTSGAGGAGASDCAAAPSGPLPLIPGDRARLLPDGSAAAPESAPAAVKGIIAAGNQIAGKPYVYGGGHGIPLNQVAASYDCSSSVEHLLYGGGLLPASYDAASGSLESFGRPGPGRWVTIYASADHVFMYVAGLRWDTHNAAGPQDGSAGIGWHPLVRDATGFVVRHPAGL